MDSVRIVAHLARVTMPRRWRTYAGVSILLGLTIGLSLFAIAGARRTQSSYPRLLDAVDASTLSVGGAGYDPAANAAIAGFPEVSRSRTSVGLSVYVLDGDEPDARAQPLIEPAGTFDGQYADQDRFTATRGRLADPDRASEVVVNEFTAERLSYEVGDRLDVGLYDDFFDLTDPPPPTERRTVTIVGIGLFPDEVLQDEADRTSRVLFTPAFTRASADYVDYSLQALTLRNGESDIAAVKGRLGETNPPGTLEFRVTRVVEHHAVQATRPLSVALAVFGVVVGLAGLVLSAQAISRLLRSERREREVLRTLGASPPSIILRALTGPVLAVVGGAALAVALAVLASPAMPVGPVRDLGVGRGFDADAAVLGLGALIVVVVLTSVAAIAAWWDTSRRLGRQAPVTARPSRVASAAVGAGFSPPAVMGLRLALQTADGDGPVRSRSVAVAAGLAVAAVVAALVFGASLGHLVDEPRLFGWDWDAVILGANGYGNVTADGADHVLEQDPNVAAWSGAYFGSDLIDGHETPLLGLAPGSDVVPPIIEGRAITSEDDIVLGPATADQLGVGVGDTVALGATGSRRRLTVRGLAVLPTIGVIYAGHPSLGVGAIVAPDLVPGSDLDITLSETGDFGPNAILVRYQPDTDDGAQLAHLRETTRPLAGFTGLDVLPVQRPAEIVNSDSLGGLPAFLAAALVVGAITSLALALMASVRRRRRELALVKTLGFTRRQLASTVAWHATATIVVGLLVGIPLGVAAGRLAWSRFADQLDVVAQPVAPVMALVAIVVGALVVANVAAWLPARQAGRVEASTVLRRE